MANSDNKNKRSDNGNEAIICIVGLGYVGLPLAVAFGKQYKVIGFDLNKRSEKKLSFEVFVPNTFSDDTVYAIVTIGNNKDENSEMIGFLVE